MSQYRGIAFSNDETVVTEFKGRERTAGSYQSEDAMEKKLIQDLVAQGYEPIAVHCEKDLISNLRIKIGALNNYEFTDQEWETFFKDCISRESEPAIEKTRRIQRDHIQVLKRPDGTFKNIMLIDKDNINNNCVQVLNQFEEDGGKRNCRYDVTILVNGLPLTHIELKRRGVQIKEAFNQIARYKRESFWAGTGLYEYIQIFVISNGTQTKYYSNTTRESQLNAKGHSNRGTSNSFEFTSFWADANNKRISDIEDFTKTFLTKRTLLNIITKYCVLTEQDLLLVMRPYQIVASERIIQKIICSTNSNDISSINSGGYIFHGTGTGKSLASFKTAQLATQLGFIEKVIFVVDRKDLDYQTMREYDRFQKGAANGNTSTNVLSNQLSDKSSKIIITTIQKLNCLIKKNAKHSIYDKHIVMIFDECHRTQFGEMHRRIKKAFKKYHLFGFTGTPIFVANARTQDKETGEMFKTTAQLFGDQLHAYTVVDAIRDGNVLPFKIDYLKTMDIIEEADDEDVLAINTKEALYSQTRTGMIVEYILKHFDKKTYRNRTYTKDNKRLNGFNSLFCVQTIPAAIRYYDEFKRQQEHLDNKLKVAMIYSFGVNDEVDDSLFPEIGYSEEVSQSHRDFLDLAIKDYNEMFGTSFSTSSDQYESYYKDLSLRIKNKEVDICIVVNMLLTGFDATSLNTLWVDKNLRMHGLFQAFSRTNRILNDVKVYGNIVCFRNLKRHTDEAIGLFGNKDSQDLVLLRSYDDYINGYIDEHGAYKVGYKGLVEVFKETYKTDEHLYSEELGRGFVNDFGALLRMKNLLSTFDDFKNDMFISSREEEDYKSEYLDIKDRFEKRERANQDSIMEDITFELTLIEQDETSIDYILEKVQEAIDEADENFFVELGDLIGGRISASPTLRNKKDLIHRFLDEVNDTGECNWDAFVEVDKYKEIEDLIEKYNLNRDATIKFIVGALVTHKIQTVGPEVDLLMPPMSRYTAPEVREARKAEILLAIIKLFNEYN